jgi:hypothetical protein
LPWRGAANEAVPFGGGNCKHPDKPDTDGTVKG